MTTQTPRATAQKFPVVFNVSVYKSSHPLSSSTGLGATDWQRCIANTQRELDFYAQLEDGAPFVADASSNCAECEGTGKVAYKHRRLYARKVCPTCHGRNSSVSVLPELLVALNEAKRGVAA